MTHMGNKFAPDKETGILEYEEKKYLVIHSQTLENVIAQISNFYEDKLESNIKLKNHEKEIAQIDLKKKLITLQSNLQSIKFKNERQLEKFNKSKIILQIEEFHKQFVQYENRNNCFLKSEIEMKQLKNEKAESSVYGLALFSEYENLSLSYEKMLKQFSNNSSRLELKFTIQNKKIKSLELKNENLKEENENLMENCNLKTKQQQIIQNILKNNNINLEVLHKNQKLNLIQLEDLEIKCYALKNENELSKKLVKTLNHEINFLTQIPCSFESYEQCLLVKEVAKLENSHYYATCGNLKKNVLYVTNNVNTKNEIVQDTTFELEQSSESFNKKSKEIKQNICEKIENYDIKIQEVKKENENLTVKRNASIVHIVKLYEKDKVLLFKNNEKLFEKINENKKVLEISKNENEILAENLLNLHNTIETNKKIWKITMSELKDVLKFNLNKYKKLQNKINQLKLNNEKIAKENKVLINEKQYCDKISHYKKRFKVCTTQIRLFMTHNKCLKNEIIQLKETIESHLTNEDIFEQKHRENQSQIKVLESQIQELRQKNITVNQQMEGKENWTENMRKEIVELNNTLDLNSTEVALLVQKIKEKESNSKSQNENSQYEISNLNELMQKQTSKNENLKKTISKLNTKIKILESTSQNKIISLNEKIEENISKIDSLKAGIVDLKELSLTNKIQLEGQIKKYESKLQTCESDNENLNKNIVFLNHEIEVNCKANEKLKNKISAKNETIELKLANEAILKQKINEYESKLVKNERKSKHLKALRLTKKIKFEEQIKEYESKLKTYKAHNKNLKILTSTNKMQFEEKIRQYKSKLKTYEAENASLNKTITFLTQEVQESYVVSYETNKKLSKKLSELNEMIESNSTNQVIQEQEITKFQSKLENLKSKNHNCNKEITTLVATFSQLTNKFENETQKLLKKYTNLSSTLLDSKVRFKKSKNRVQDLIAKMQRKNAEITAHIEINENLQKQISEFTKLNSTNVKKIEKYQLKLNLSKTQSQDLTKQIYTLLDKFQNVTNKASKSQKNIKDLEQINEDLKNQNLTMKENTAISLSNLDAKIKQHRTKYKNLRKTNENLQKLIKSKHAGLKAAKNISKSKRRSSESVGIDISSRSLTIHNDNFQIELKDKEEEILTLQDEKTLLKGKIKESQQQNKVLQIEFKSLQQKHLVITNKYKNLVSQLNLMEQQTQNENELKKFKNMDIKEFNDKFERETASALQQIDALHSKIIMSHSKCRL